jgi:hypothetical protein
MWRVAQVFAAVLGVAASVAVAQPAPPPLSQAVPRGADPATGARPGNEIGTGSSLPLSDKAGNITPENTTSVLAPNLPAPSVGENASPRDYLLAARAALVLGRTGEAQQALEMAETRALDRSVPLFKTDVRINDPLIGEIEQALHALGEGDRERSVQIIETALPHADQPAAE